MLVGPPGFRRSTGRIALFQTAACGESFAGILMGQIWLLRSVASSSLPGRFYVMIRGVAP
jgi:hypothetical protein